jgi:hypothetical protein
MDASHTARYVRRHDATVSGGGEDVGIEDIEDRAVQVSAEMLRQAGDDLQVGQDDVAQIRIGLERGRVLHRLLDLVEQRLTNLQQVLGRAVIFEITRSPRAQVHLRFAEKHFTAKWR